MSETGDKLVQLEAAKKSAKWLVTKLNETRELPKNKVEMGEAEIKKKACLLLETYSFLDVGPSTELVHLIAKCMDVSADPFVSRDRDIPAKNYEAWDRAVQFEGGSEPDTTGKHPSTAAVNAVAKAAFPSTKGDHRKTIMSWRTHEKYQSEVAATRECIKIGLINKE